MDSMMSVNNIPSKLLGILFCVWLISGCASRPPLYNWGNYESQVYARFAATSSPEQQIGEMERILQTNRQQLPAPPGFHAHLGLLYGEVGRTNEMREQFAIEKKLFPESSTFMDFLLKKSNNATGRTQ